MPKNPNPKKYDTLFLFHTMAEVEKNIELVDINVVKKESPEVAIREQINP